MAIEDEDSTLEVKGLDALIAALGVPAPTIRVGILGEKPRQVKAGSKAASRTNAEIGAAHEFGTSKLPQRSWLRAPLASHFEKALEKAGAFDADALSEVMSSRNLLPYAFKMAVTAEAVILEAFNTGGYGKWPASDMTKKQNAQTLVETRQLRDAVSTEVKEGSA